MKYTRFALPPETPQLLRVNHEGEAYDTTVLHAEDMVYPEVRGGAPYLEPDEHAHAVYHVVLYTRGRNTFRLRGAAHPSRAGVLVLTAPGEPHAFGASECAPRVHSLEITFAITNGTEALGVPWHRILALYTGLDLPEVAYPMQLEPPESERLAGRMEGLLHRLQRRDALAWFDEQRLLLELFGDIVRAVYVPHLELGPLSIPAWLERVREEIDCRTADRVTLEDLAGLAGLSPAHVCRAFKAAYGLSPIAYQRRQRMQAAATLLGCTPLSVSEIGRRVGYDDVYVFSKSFRRAMGASPSAYRAGSRGG